MIITDTGAFVALINSRDKYHTLVQPAFAVKSEPLVTTYPVISETCHLLKRSVSLEAERLFLQTIIAGVTEVFQLHNSHLLRMTKLMKKYEDLPMDLADASLVVLAEELKDGRILTIDRRDFSVYRWNNTQPFQNLLFSDR